MTNEAKENKMIVLEGMSWVRVFAACQSLMCPTKFYSTHKRAREVLREELGFCPKGKPGEAGEYNSGFRSGGKEAMYDWLGVVHIETHKEEGCVLPTDRTLLVIKS
jgi:hypothetical protein